MLLLTECSAGLNSTDFVFFKTRLPEAIGEINLKYRSMCFVTSFRVEEYIASGRDKFIVDPDPNKIYTKCKDRECSISLPDSSSQDIAGT